MKTINFLTYFISFCFAIISNKAIGQHLDFLSVEGKNINVNVSDTLNGRVTKISCATDALYLSNCFGNRKASIVNKKFLNIVYAVRGGTGLQIKNTILLMIVNGKFKPCLCMRSYVYSFAPNLKNTSTLSEENWFKLIIKSININDNKLKLSIQSKHESKIKPKENKTISKLITLDFDEKKFIFYNSKIKFSSEIKANEPYFLKYNLSTYNLNEDVPVIDLGTDYKYYFFNNGWFHREDENIFYKDYFN